MGSNNQYRLSKGPIHVWFYDNGCKLLKVTHYKGGRPTQGEFRMIEDCRTLWNTLISKGYIRTV